MRNDALFQAVAISYLKDFSRDAREPRMVTFQVNRILVLIFVCQDQFFAPGRTVQDFETPSPWHCTLRDLLILQFCGSSIGTTNRMPAMSHHDERNDGQCAGSSHSLFHSLSLIKAPSVFQDLETPPLNSYRKAGF
jgi:hypothetical protein